MVNPSLKVLSRDEASTQFMRQFEWGEDPWYQNVGLVFADQGANMLFFIGTMGVGTTLGAGRLTSMYVASGGVGLQEGGRTHHRLLSYKENAKIDPQYKDEPWYQKAEEFTDQWDQAAFDPNYEVDSLDSFKTLIIKFFEVPQKLI